MFRKNFVQRKTNVYIIVHKIYAFLAKEVLTVGALISSAISLTAIFCAWYFVHKFEFPCLIPFGIYILIWAIAKLLLFAMQHLMNVSGTSDKFIFLGKYLIRPNKKAPCEIRLEGIDTKRFEFVTEATVQLAAELNARAFSRGSWKDSADAKFARNLSHVQRNNLSMMFVKSLVEQKVLGFTHILPVTKSTWKSYLNGEIKDNTYSAEDICPNFVSNRKHEKPYGLIIFSIANIGYDDEIKTAPDFYTAIGEIYEQAAVFHANELLKSLFKEKEIVPILFQNMGKEFMDFFKKCNTSNTNISGDCDRIITFSVINPHFIH